MNFILLLFISHILLFSQEVEPEILKSLEDNYNSKYRVLLSEGEDHFLSGAILHSFGYDWGKVRVGKDSKNIYESGKDVITAMNTGSGHFASTISVEKIVFKAIEAPIYNPLEAFSFDSAFSNTLPANPNNYFKDIKLKGGEFSPVSKIYFRPQLPGEYEIYFYFNSDSEIIGQETRYTLKGTGIAPNVCIYNKGVTFDEYENVDFGNIEANNENNYSTRNIIIQNRIKDSDYGDVLKIDSISWGSLISISKENINSLPFILDEQLILDSFGTDGDYPIYLDINEYIEFDVTFIGGDLDIVYFTEIEVFSDSDESGTNGRHNSRITLTGNSAASSVKYDKDVFSIYPNPANDKINIELKDIGKIEIIDFEGNIIYKKDILKVGVNEIDISQFSSGTYIIKYYSNQEVYFNKFIKK